MNGVVQFQEEEVKFNFRWFERKFNFQVNFSKISERKREKKRKNIERKRGTNRRETEDFSLTF